MAIVDCIHTATRRENQAEISVPVRPPSRGPARGSLDGASPRRFRKAIPSIPGEERTPKATGSAARVPRPRIPGLPDRRPYEIIRENESLRGEAPDRMRRTLRYNRLQTTFYNM